jgi:hypothetical protein
MDTVVSMILGIAGGCGFPPESLPAFLRNYVTPFLPTAWFAGSLRRLEAGGANPSWILNAVALAGVAAVLMIAATVLFGRRFKTGVRP